MSREKDCIDFGYWLVNAPNKQIYSKKCIEQKYQQYKKECKDNIQRWKKGECI